VINLKNVKLKKKGNFKNENRGITLIALAITIIIILILAGISINTLTGDNGIIGKAAEAKTRTEIDREKELIETAAVQAMGKQRNGSVTVKGLQDELKNDGEVEKIRKDIVVTMKDSKRQYSVDDDGNVYEYEYVELSVMSNSIFRNKLKSYASYSDILSVKVLDNVNIPEDAKYTFEVSEDKKIKAWLMQNSEDNEKYDLYIGGNKGIIIDSCEHLFSHFENCITIDLENLYTDNVTNMIYMFYYCKSLKNLNISNLATSKVTNMAYLFAVCNNLEKIDLSNFDTSNVIKMERMFRECWKLSNLDLSNFNTSKVDNMWEMFYECKSIEQLDLTNFDTSNVTDMSSMFESCSKLSNLNISSFNTSKVKDMGKMFRLCSSVTSLNLSSFNTSNVTNMSYMFQGCNTLTSLDLSSFDTSNVTNMQMLFYNCGNNLESLNIINFDTSKVTNMYRMFAYNRNLKTITVSASKWVIAEGTDTTEMYLNCGVTSNDELDKR